MLGFCVPSGVVLNMKLPFLSRFKASAKKGIFLSSKNEPSSL